MDEKTKLKIAFDRGIQFADRYKTNRSSKKWNKLHDKEYNNILDYCKCQSTGE